MGGAVAVHVQRHSVALLLDRWELRSFGCLSLHRMAKRQSFQKHTWQPLICRRYSVFNRARLKHGRKPSNTLETLAVKMRWSVVDTMHVENTCAAEKCASRVWWQTSSWFSYRRKSWTLKKVRKILEPIRLRR